MKKGKSCKKKYRLKKSKRATSTHEFLEDLSAKEEGEKDIKNEEETEEETEEEEIVEENLGEDNDHLEDEEQGEEEEE